MSNGGSIEAQTHTVRNRLVHRNLTPKPARRETNHPFAPTKKKKKKKRGRRKKKEEDKNFVHVGDRTHGVRVAASDHLQQGRSEVSSGRVMKSLADPGEGLTTERSQLHVDHGAERGPSISQPKQFTSLETR